jgi:N-acetylneuraminic acid mutarotase
MTANLFDTSLNWAGSGQYAFDRTRMLAGQTATMQLHELGPEDWGGMLPSDLDGTTLPPAGAPNTFMEVNDDGWSFPPYTYHDEIQIWQYHIDWVTPANSTFTGPVLLPVASYDGIACPNFARACIRQPGTGNRVDAITDRGLYRQAYRNFGTHESIVFNQTVDLDGNDQGHTGIRWYEVRSPRSSPVLYQQGTYGPDAASRWMGSAAMDRQGNMAIGYSISDATSIFPSIRYAGRLVTDPLGQLAQGEATMFAGAGSQTGFDRWGDYSVMSIDPTDDCTFWYTQEYYASSSSGGFTTRIGSFKYPGCTGGGPTNTPGATFTPAPPTATPTRTATPACGATPPWTSASPVPTARGRAVGATIGNHVYMFGGRPDNATFAQTVYDYNTTTGAWQLMSATLPDAMTSNMAAGVLTFPEGQRAFVVGGSGTGSVVTGRTLAFNPASGGSFAAKATWPAAPTHLPGGWAVANNKFYIFGGFTSLPTPGSVYNDIWQYDPTTDAWTQLSAVLSMARGYIATEYNPADGMIYLAGGSQIDATGSLTDESIFEKFNVSTGAVSAGPAPLEPKSNAHGYMYGGKFYVPAGGFVAANHNTHVQIYNPTANSWSLGTDVVNTARNYTKGYGADGALYMFGGLDPGATTWYDYNQMLAAPAGCTTPTPGPSNTPTATNTPGGATPTPCGLTFSDVNPPDYFYVPVMYLACHGVISGYSDGTFRPYNNTTRGQLSKIIVLAEGWPIDTTGGPHFSDVPTTHTFYTFIETAYNRGIISGYSDGTFRPGNDVTRGQLCKIIVLAEEWPIDTTGGPHFSDVPTTHTFYDYVETAYNHGIISGYSDGTFRPGNSATRGQISKIVYEAITGP